MSSKLNLLKAKRVESKESDNSRGKGKRGDDDEEVQSPSADIGKQLDGIKKSIKTIEANVAQMKKLNDKPQFSEKEQQDIMIQIEGLVNSSKTEALQTTQTIKKLEAETAKMEKDNPGSTSVQIRRNMLDTNKKQLAEAVSEYQSVSEAIKNSFKENIKRQVRLVDGKISEAQLEQAVNSANPHAILQQALGVSSIALDAVAELEERHERMRSIEQGVKEILELFQDLAVLVSEQQETLDVISHNVTQAKVNTKEGEKNLVQAEKSQKTSRKCMCFAMVIGGVVLILVVVFASVFTKK